MKILYLHNFGDAEQDRHYALLHRLFPDAEIVTTSANYTECPILDTIFNYECIEDIDCIVGNGFGGFLAYIAGIANDTKTILINPYIPMAEYLAGILFIEENRDMFNSLWENNKGQNKHCSVILDAKTQVPDLDKTFDALKDIADIYIHCAQEDLTDSAEYATWLTAHIN